MKLNRYNIYSLTIAFILILSGGMLHYLAPESDKAVFRFINGHHVRWLDEFMLPVTYCGNTVVLVIVAFVVLVLRGGKRFFQALSSLFSAGLLVTIAKRFFPTARPASMLPDVNILGPCLQYFSFPSGHTAAVFALACLVRKEFPALVPLFWVMAVLVGISRIYVGGHFLSDVIAGAGLGYIAGYAVSLLFSVEKKTLKI
jgi:undecaprenyl-diphosphatase